MEETLLDDSVDTNKKYYEDLVGEGKKFKDQEDLAKGKWMADQHISTLERRLDEMRTDFLAEREQNTTRAKLEELIQKIEQSRLTSSTEPTPKEVQPEFNPDQISSLVSKQIQQHEISKRQAENFNLVKNKLVEKFGDNYQTHYKDRLNALGLSPEFADSLAKTSPKAFISTLGLDQRSEGFSGPPQNSSSFSPKTPEKRTYSYYQKLRKDNPRLYYDSKIANEMDKVASEMGEAFFDVD